MAMSTFQKVTLATCLVLCVALLLPKMLLSRGRKDAGERPEGSGRFPPMMHRQTAPEGRGQRAAAAGSGYSRAHNTEAITRAKGAGTGAGTGGKSNLAGQIIPVYGFGILLYILYILFKITSKGSSKPSEGRFPSVRSENMKRKITDFELAQLQEKLMETELVMEDIVSTAHHSPDRMKRVTADQEENLLLQLTEITRVMQEGQLVEGMAAEKKQQDDWEDDPEEPRPHWEHSHCCCHTEQSHGQRGESDRTQAEEEDLPEDGGDPEEAERLSGDATHSEGTAASREEAEKQIDLGQDEEEAEKQIDLGQDEEEAQPHEHKEDAGRIDLGVPDDDLVGVLRELELTLRVTSMMEQEKMEDLARPTEASGGSVRRRNKRRRAKKAAQLT